jgi:hypothetical protein
VRDLELQGGLDGTEHGSPVVPLAAAHPGAGIHGQGYLDRRPRAPGHHCTLFDRFASMARPRELPANRFGSSPSPNGYRLGPELLIDRAQNQTTCCYDAEASSK